jgi:hypothetical protein
MRSAILRHGVRGIIYGFVLTIASLVWSPIQWYTVKGITIQELLGGPFTYLRILKPARFARGISPSFEPLHFDYTWFVIDWIILATIAFAICAFVDRIHQSIVSERKALAQKQNCCISCGYDLRGSVSRCPECGTTMAHGESANQ